MKTIVDAVLGSLTSAGELIVALAVIKAIAWLIGFNVLQWAMS